MAVLLLVAGTALFWRGGLPQFQTISQAFNRTLNHVVSFGIQWTVFGIVLYWVLHLFPGDVGTGIRKAYIQSIGAVLKLVKALAFGFVRGLLSLFGVGNKKT